MQLLKKMAATLPDRWQNELKRIHFGRQIRKNTFITPEPEYAVLHEYISPGDWVLDIGANVGHYTKRFSDLVGSGGRVIAFEPVPTTFALLAANVELLTHPNVTLFNAAVSDKLDVAGMDIPTFSTGLANFYEAHLSEAAEGGLSVITLSLDSLGIDRRVSLIKIDAEGHEAYVLEGMKDLIDRFHPVLIVETGKGDIIGDLESRGYEAERLPGSPNVVFKPVS